MTFKLGAQADDIGDPTLPSKLYKSYIEHNKWRIPESALEVISHPDWVGGCESKAPHDSHLIAFEIKDFGKPSAELKLVLLKERYSEPHFYLEVNYKGLFAIDIPNQQLISENPCVWRCDEFLYFEAYSSYEIKDKLFTHHIEWVGRKVWSITARNIKVEWKYFKNKVQ